jgi:hypothetical protein
MVENASDRENENVENTSGEFRRMPDIYRLVSP